MVKGKIATGLTLGLGVLMAFTSCGAKGGKQLSKEEAEVQKALEKQFKSEGYTIQKKGGKVYDLDGIVVRIADWWSDPNGLQGQPANSPAEEEQKKFRQFTMNAYNMDVDAFGIGGWGAHPQTVANFCTTGGDENYIFVVDSRSTAPGLKANLFYDLSTIDSVDWNNPKWNKAVRGTMSKGKSFYGCRPEAPEPKTGVFFNKRLLKEANIDPESIYDMQANGTWTWETFEQMLKATTRDTDNDGVIDTYGMGNLNGQFCAMAVMSNGSCWIDKDENGKYFSRIGDEKTIEAMNWVAKIVKAYEKPQPEGSNWDWFYASFINGEVAFQCDDQYRCGNIADMQDDWGFVCFPLGPQGDGVYKTFANDNVYVLPGCYDSERAEKIMKAFDLWSDPTPGYPDDAWKETYYSRFRDNRAVDETLQLFRDNAIPRYDGMIAGLDLGPLFIWNAYPGNITMQEGYESSKNQVQALIDEANR